MSDEETTTLILIAGMLVVQKLLHSKANANFDSALKVIYKELCDAP